MGRKHLAWILLSSIRVLSQEVRAAGNIGHCMHPKLKLARAVQRSMDPCQRSVLRANLVHELQVPYTD